jgi:hypothetical protein
MLIVGSASERGDCPICRPASRRTLVQINHVFLHVQAPSAAFFGFFAFGFCCISGALSHISS